MTWYLQVDRAAIQSMKLLMGDLIVKETLSMVLLMHTAFGAPSVGQHDDLIRLLGLRFVDIHHAYGNVSIMGGNHYADGYDFGC